MGRPPTPTAVLKLRGSERATARGPEPEGSPDAPPQMLPAVAADPVARGYFERLVADLKTLRLYAGEDYLAHNHYALAASEFDAAQEMVKTGGLILETPNQGRYLNPAIKAREIAADKLAKFGQLFGLSPASRVGLKADAKPKTNALAEILQKKTA
jgi:P27 family predicted phage terminase small subunit